MPWEKSYNDTEVLERAMGAFWSRGYSATSMNDLVTATGINRGSLYAAFDGKHELFMCALRHYDNIHRAEHLQRISEQYEPLEAILAVFKAATKLPGNHKCRGCLLVNTALEMSPHDDEVAGLINQSLQAVENFFHQHLNSAQQDGNLDPAMDIGTTAQALLGLFLGLRVLIRSNAPKSTTNSIINQVKIIIFANRLV